MGRSTVGRDTSQPHFVCLELQWGESGQSYLTNALYLGAESGGRERTRWRFFDRGLSLVDNENTASEVRCAPGTFEGNLSEMDKR
jgi:hypothetical protein